MADDPKLAAARRDAAIARDRLMGSVHTLQARVAPSKLANDALETARERGTAAVETVSTAAKDNPRVATGVAIGTAAFLLRRPIFRLFRRKKHPNPPARSDDAARHRKGDDR